MGRECLDMKYFSDTAYCHGHGAEHGTELFHVLFICKHYINVQECTKMYRSRNE